MSFIMNINWKWEDMCGPGGLHPWNDATKDFSVCFQELFLQVPVYFIIAIVSGYFVGYRKDWVIREKNSRTCHNISKFCCFRLSLHTDHRNIYIYYQT